MQNYELCHLTEADKNVSIDDFVVSQVYTIGVRNLLTALTRNFVCKVFCWIQISDC